MVGITGPNEHLQCDDLFPGTLSFYFPSEFRGKRLLWSLSESPCPRHHVNLPKHFCSRHALACLGLESAFRIPTRWSLREAYGCLGSSKAVTMSCFTMALATLHILYLIFFVISGDSPASGSLHFKNRDEICSSRTVLEWGRVRAGPLRYNRSGRIPKLA